MTRLKPSLAMLLACMLVLSCEKECDPEPQTGEPSSEGLIAYYPFNGNANDQTDNNLDGIVHGASLTNNRKGVERAAYSFDGFNDYIQVPHNNLLNLSGDFSISLWANVAANQEPESGINDILRKWNGDAQGYPFAISYLNELADDLQEDKMLYARYDGQTCGHSTTSNSSIVSNDTFIHIVLIRDGNKIRSYANGEMISEVNDLTTCATGNQADMTIGCRGNLVRFFRGVIDDIRIYNRILSENEITNLYEE